MRNIGKLVHVALTLAFVAILASIPMMAQAAEVGLTLEWAAPVDGGPVDGYAVTCTGDIPVDESTAETSLTASGQFDSGTVSGNCEVRAFNQQIDPVTSEIFTQFGPAAAASYSFALDITAPPGAPTNFTISFECSAVDGVVTCEQV